jgi:hypothetical protein
LIDKGSDVNSMTLILLLGIKCADMHLYLSAAQIGEDTTIESSFPQDSINIFRILKSRYAKDSRYR